MSSGVVEQHHIFCLIATRVCMGNSPEIPRGKKLIELFVIIFPMWLTVLQPTHWLILSTAAVFYTLLVVFYLWWDGWVGKTLNIIWMQISFYQKYLHEQKRREIEVQIISTLDAVRELTPKYDHFRASLFIYDASNDILRFGYGSGAFSAKEQGLTFGRRQGLVGYVLTRYDTDFDWFFAELHDIDSETLIKTWHMTQEQISATRQLVLIIAVPIVSKGQLQGILTIDTANATAGHNVKSVYEDRPEFREQVTIAAATCAELLNDLN